MLRLLTSLLLLSSVALAQESASDFERLEAMLADRPLDAAVGEASLELHDRAWLAGAYEPARRALRRHRTWLDGLHAHAPLEHADALKALGVRLRNVHHLPAAREAFERTLELVDAHAGSPSVRALTVRELAIVTELEGDAAGARPLYEEVLAAIEGGLDLGRSTPAILHDDLALNLLRQGLLDEAEAHLDQALALKRALPDLQATSLATTLNNLVFLHFERRDGAAALPRAREVLALREQALPADHPDVAQARANLSAVLVLLGDQARTIDLARQAVDSLEQLGRTGTQDYAEALQALGSALMRMGRLDEAVEAQERSVSVSEALLGPDHPLLGRHLAGLGGTLNMARRPADARAVLERALAILDTHHQGPHRELIPALQGLAQALSATAGPDAAWPFIERAEALLAELGMQHTLEAAHLAAQAADVLWSAGRLDEAARAHERAIALHRATSPDGFIAYDEQAQLVLLELDAGRSEAAWVRAGALQADLLALRRTLAGLAERDALSFLASRRELLSAVLSGAEAVGTPEAAYPAVLETKGRAFRLLLGGKQALRQMLDTDLEALAARLDAVQAELAGATLAADPGHTDGLRTERLRLERRLRAAVDVSDEGVVTPAALAAALPPDSALVDLVSASRWEPGSLDGRPARGRHGAPRVSAFVTTADGLSVVDLGPEAVLREALVDHLAAIDAGAAVRGRSHGRPGRPTRAGPGLRTLLWDPLAAVLGDVHTVFMVPDGALARVPFATLDDGAGGYLLEHHAFVSLTDAAALLRLPAEAAPLGDGLLVVGGVDYDHGPWNAPRVGDHERALMLRHSDGPWAALPGTQDEALTLAGLHAARVGSDPLVTLFAEQAHEAAVRQALPRVALAHLATHGFFGLDGAPGLAAAAPDDPGLLSGLVLAGVHAPPEDGHDGYLTAAEVATLDLPDLDLVVLSACETGLGTAQAGEGLLGLRRAFHVAGADTVIGSLWAVGDTSTRTLMLAFYRGLFEQGLPRHAAFRAAQLALLAEDREQTGVGRPARWGAFVLSGEWR